MSSDYDYIISLITAQTFLFQVGGTILIGVGSISCALSFIVFAKKTIRRDPCAIYFLAYTAANLFTICTSILYATLTMGYNIYRTVSSPIFCPAYAYAVHLSDILNPFYLILASIDRVLVTSKEARIRRLSTHRLAYTALIGGTILWMIVQLHAVFFMRSIPVAPNAYICALDPALYQQIMDYYLLIVKSICVPLLLAVLGLWAIRNVRALGGRTVGPVTLTRGARAGNVINAPRSKDRELIKVVLINIIFYVLLNMMLTGVVLYKQITQNEDKGWVQIYTQIVLYNIAVFIYYVPFCTGCFINLLTSKKLRKEIINRFLCK